jgi:iron uptake system EfeUOB component EfeO/EfeM
MARRKLSLLRPQLQKENSELLAKVDANFKKVDTILAKYRTKDGFETYDKLTDADRNALKGPITTWRKICLSCVAYWVWTKHDEQARRIRRG